MIDRARRRALLASLLTLALAAFACTRRYLPAADAAWGPGTHTHALTLPAGERTYLMHIPTSRPRNRFGITTGYPVVIVLHGSGADGETVRVQTGMDALADSLHLITVYPNASTGLFGLGADWNAGTCCGAAERANVDDLGFLRAIVSDLSAHVPIDHNRIYAAGFSDGGRLAYHVGCDAASLVAAIGVVSGSMLDDSCHPSTGVPLIAFHGTADTEVSYDEAARTAPPSAPIAASVGLPPSVRFWSALNHCHRLSLRRTTAHVLRAQFGGCAGDVLFFSIDGGAHAWPGGAKDGPGGFTPTPEVDASRVMINFFLRHPRRSGR